MYRKGGSSGCTKRLRRRRFWGVAAFWPLRGILGDWVAGGYTVSVLSGMVSGCLCDHGMERYDS